ncbi:MAG: serine hydrolase domain-containing protein [Alphaproteobacteria bacterium]
MGARHAISRLTGLIFAAAMGAQSLAGSAAQAAEGGDTAAMERALAAGYKATFLCSGLFTGKRPLPVIAANELSRHYPDYRDIMATLPGALIDRAAKTVSVAWSETLPPRIAAWRPGMGCSQLPMGAGPSMVALLPRLASPMPDVPPKDDAKTLSPDAGPATVADADALAGVIERAFDADTYGAGTKTSGLVVVRNGTILAEAYAHGLSAESPQRTWSVAKSISATVIGAAVEDALVSPEAPAALEAWSSPRDPRGTITLANLLNMASGLDSGVTGSRTDRLYFGGARVIDRAVPAGLEVAPGSRFKYANNDTLLAMRVLRERMGDDAVFHAYPYRAVLWRIGAYRTVLETDWNGDFLSSSQVWTTARDLARIGQLHLQDGLWGKERILAKGWTAYVATPAPAQPSAGAWGYGAQWWLPNGEAGLPLDAFMAAGHRGQYIVVVPSANLVIVRRGYDESGGQRFLVTRFAADIHAAVAGE